MTEDGKRIAARKIILREALHTHNSIRSFLGFDFDMGNLREGHINGKLLHGTDLSLFSEWLSEYIKSTAEMQQYAYQKDMTYSMFRSFIDECLSKMRDRVNGKIHFEIELYPDTSKSEKK